MNNEGGRNNALLNILDNAVAERKRVSVICLSLRAATRKTYMDKNSTMKNVGKSLEDIRKTVKKRLIRNETEP